MLKEDKNKKREERHKITQEDFTPDVVVIDMLSKLPSSTFSNIRKTVLDTSCGIGNFLVHVLQRKLEYCHTIDEVIVALKSVYGVELMADNVEECRNRLYKMIIEKYPQVLASNKLDYKVRSIIKCRIQWYDSLLFDYTNWPRIRSKGGNDINISFTEMKNGKNPNYPMWETKEEVKLCKQLEIQFPNE